MRPRITRAALPAVLLLGPLSATAQSAFPPDSMIQSLIEQRVARGSAAAIVLGLIEPDGSTRVLIAGDPGTGRRLDAQSVFEIGSITKVFTGTLLADMVRRGEVALDDPVSKYLPAGVKVPSRGEREITLGLLAQQRSGLPRLPGNLLPADPLNPYADYTVEQLYEFLSGYTLPRDPGAQYEYSNLGVGLLGHVLALRAGKSYEQLVRERILGPAGMEHTGITLTPWMRAHLLAGHNASGDTVPLWDLPTLAGAGALRSNAEDMLSLAKVAVRGSGPVHQALALAMQPRADAGSPAMMIGLGWHRRVTSSDTIVWHNGGTGGFRTFLGLAPRSGRGLVLLTNSGGSGSDDLGFHLLDGSLPLTPWREAVDVPASVLARYLGTYQLTPQFSIEITLVAGALHGQPTNQPRFRLWAASETRFFLREVEAEVTFDLGADGRVSRLVLHQNGRDLPGAKVR